MYEDDGLWREAFSNALAARGWSHSIKSTWHTDDVTVEILFDNATMRFNFPAGSLRSKSPSIRAAEIDKILRRRFGSDDPKEEFQHVVSAQLPASLAGSQPAYVSGKEPQAAEDQLQQVGRLLPDSIRDDVMATARDYLYEKADTPGKEVGVARDLRFAMTRSAARIWLDSWGVPITSGCVRGLGGGVTVVTLLSLLGLPPDPVLVAVTVAVSSGIGGWLEVRGRRLRRPRE